MPPTRIANPPTTESNIPTYFLAPKLTYQLSRPAVLCSANLTRLHLCVYWLFSLVPGYFICLCAGWAGWLGWLRDLSCCLLSSMLILLGYPIFWLANRAEVSRFLSVGWLSFFLFAASNVARNEAKRSVGAEGKATARRVEDCCVVGCGFLGFFALWKWMVLEGWGDVEVGFVFWGAFATEEHLGMRWVDLGKGLGGGRWEWGFSLLFRSSPSAGRQHMRIFRCCRYVVCRMCGCFKCEGIWD